MHSAASTVKQFIEDLAIALSEDGMSRMAARVLAAITCSNDKSGLTQADLAVQLSASPAAISTAARELLTTNHIIRVSIPNERADRYQLADVAESTIGRVVERHRNIASTYRGGLKLFTEDSLAYRTMQENITFHTQFANLAAAIPQMLATQRSTSGR